MNRAALIDRLAPPAEAGETGSTEAGNALIQLVSLSMTKLADGLINPKLVLAWLLGAVGAPAAAVGALVPVREAGALLPQLALARRVEASPQRKWFWVAGSAVQGLAALGIAASVLALEGAAAGWAVVGCLAVLALARAACSVSHKDTLARTVQKTRRGAITGAAGTAGSAAVLIFGGLLALGVIPLGVTAIAVAVMVAGGLWMGAALLFRGLDEPAEANGDEEGLGSLLRPLAEDGQLRRFILARALLTATALAVPYLVMLQGMREEGGLGALGPLVLASGLATILAAYVWGRLSDRSSRRTLMAAGGLAALVFAATAAAGWLTGGLGGTLGAVGAVFVAQIAYEGVRSGRKIHLTDMTDDSERARYTALSNTMIGGVLVLGGGFGVIADYAGPALVLALFAAMCALAVAVAAGLEEVQEEG